VISDNMMPGMTGVDLLKLVRVRHPHVLRIMLTGDPDPEIPVRSINESEVYRFVRKPWNSWDLRTILHFAFEVIRLQEENAKLILLGVRQRKIRGKMASADDPVGLEAELELLAEAEAELLDGG
jgi:response regulator RpfG family c-di-GMP phosphodiesterase